MARHRKAIDHCFVFLISCVAGSHTIGQARCTTFLTRINNETNIDSSFKTSTQAQCQNTNNFVPLDVTSPTSFDSAYYRNLLNQKGLLHSDQQLFSGGSTDAQVRAYSSNQAAFRTDFANAMIKMGNLSPLTGTNGQIRTNCRKANWILCPMVQMACSSCLCVWVDPKNKGGHIYTCLHVILLSCKVAEKVCAILFPSSSVQYLGKSFQVVCICKAMWDVTYEIYAIGVLFFRSTQQLEWL